MRHPHSGNRPASARDRYLGRFNARPARRNFPRNRASRIADVAISDIDLADGNDPFYQTPDSTYNTQATTSNNSTPGIFRRFGAYSSRQSSLSTATVPSPEAGNHEHQWDDVPSDPYTESALASVDTGLFSTQTPVVSYEKEDILGPTHLRAQLQRMPNLDDLAARAQDTSVAPWSVENILSQGDNVSGIVDFDNQHVTFHPPSDSQYDAGHIASQDMDTPMLTSNGDTVSYPSTSIWDDLEYRNAYFLSHETVTPGFRNADTQNDGCNQPLTISGNYRVSAMDFDFQADHNYGHIDHDQATFLDQKNDQSRAAEAVGIRELQRPVISFQAGVPAQSREILRAPQSSFLELDRIPDDVLRTIDKQRKRTQVATCWPCFGKNAKCTGQAPCMPCVRISTGIRGGIHWKSSCSKAYLESFTGILVPVKLAQSVGAQRIQSYFKENANMLFEEVFKVPVHFGFGDEVALPCQAFQPKSRRRVTHRINWSSVSGNRVVRQWQEVVSYPFTLSGRTPDVVNKLETWTDIVFSTKPRSWYQYMFNNTPHLWIPEVLEAVCDYISHFFTSLESLPSQPRSDRDKILKLAMRLCIVTYMISSAIYLSNEALADLKQTEFGRKCGITDAIAPRMLAMGIKHCLAASVYRSTELCLTRFHNMLRSRNPSDRGHGLCVLILLSIVVALNQVALTDCAHIVNTTAGHPARPIDVRADINSMEDLLASFNEYYHNIFKTRELLGKFPWRDWDKMDMPVQSLFSRILEIYISTGQVTAFRNQSFSHLEPGRIAVDNAARLISRVLSPLFPRE